MTYGTYDAAAAGQRRLALVYRGPASRPGCPEAVAELLAATPWNLEVRFTGPDEALHPTARNLSDATLYAQPGGGTLDSAYRTLRRQHRVVRDFVRHGGRYLGFCLGGYLAGATPGFGLLPGDTDQYIASPGASVHDERDTVVPVTWRGRRRTVYFQDGPLFELDEDADATILATYDNGTVAALATRYGDGRVAVTGPHPEATADWYTHHGLPVRHTLDLAEDLVDAVMRE
ncbi:BPL-N domain-containing protein [Streptomyces sp. NPDC057697]|uniref:BPL-N domain-containing protein n=1 Tax=Streptomyces sp. NPDC057697 TaxID=3346219 RepID=UPI0036933BB1